MGSNECGGGHIHIFSYPKEGSIKTKQNKGDANSDFSTVHLVQS